MFRENLLIDLAEAVKAALPGILRALLVVGLISCSPHRVEGEDSQNATERDAGRMEEAIVYDRFPRPTITPFFNLNGFGYAPVSLSAWTGINYEGRHFMFDGELGYDTARKSNDGTENNKKGHSRGVLVVSMLRISPRWLAGVRFTGGQTSTTNYKKSVWRGGFGLGRELSCSSMSCRLSVFYTLPYSDHSNGVQGPHLNFMIPSPITKHHFYFTEDVGIGILHATITDPNNRELTRYQMSQRSVSASTSFGVMFKF